MPYFLGLVAWTSSTLFRMMVSKPTFSPMFAFIKHLGYRFCIPSPLCSSNWCKPGSLVMSTTGLQGTLLTLYLSQIDPARKSIPCASQPASCFFMIRLSKPVHKRGGKADMSLPSGNRTTSILTSEYPSHSITATPVHNPL